MKVKDLIGYNLQQWCAAPHNANSVQALWETAGERGDG